MRSRVAVLGLAFAVDWLFGEPPTRLHPVVWIGHLVQALEARAPGGRAAALVYGVGLVGVPVAAAVATGALAERILAALPGPLGLAAAALCVKPAFAVRALFAAGEDVRRALETGDLAAARRALRGLCSRDPSHLDAPLVAAAAIESLAENASDSVVAPVLAYLVGGLPGAYAYRAANTLDAMVGYRGRYEYLGKCAARCDDLLNLVPARLTAALIAAGAAIGGGSARRALATARRDHGATASPNAGWPMSAMAGALGVRLEKVGHYRLGDPLRPVRAADIAASRTILTRGLGVGMLLVLGAAACRRRAAA